MLAFDLEVFVGDGQIETQHLQCVRDRLGHFSHMESLTKPT